MSNEETWLDKALAKIDAKEAHRQHINMCLEDIEGSVCKLLKVLEDRGARLTGDFMVHDGDWTVDFRGVDAWPKFYRAFFVEPLDVVNTDEFTVTFRSLGYRAAAFRVVPETASRGYMLKYVDTLSTGLKETKKFLDEVIHE